MNRLGPHDASSKPSQAASSTPAEELTSLSISTGQFKRRCEPLPHAVFAPQHYEEGYAYPLLVWLHGPGDNEHQLRRVMPLISLRNYVAIAPRGIAPEVTAPAGSADWRQHAQEIVEALDRVEECIRIAGRRFHIAPDRVFIAGFDRGGTMALRVALCEPDKFAGAVSLGGPLPAGLCPFGRINELRELPLLLSVSADSTKYPQQDVCRDLRLMHAAGLSLALRQYPGRDALTSMMLADVDRWVMDLICGSKPSG